MLAGAYAGLILAWVFGNPPGAAPDESSHYVRALGIAQGHLTGESVHDLQFPGLSPDQVRRLDIISRTYMLPDRLAPRTFGCNAFHPELSSACLHAPRNPAFTDVGFNVATLPDRAISARDGRQELLSYQATYPPYLYLLPAPVMILAGDPSTALWLGRLVNAVICASLLAIAIRLLWRRDAGPCSLVGIALAVTPMVIFCSSYLSPSGPEIAGAICLWAATISLVRTPRTVSARTCWTALTVAGTIVAIARPTGPLWILAAAAFMVASLGVRPTVRLARRNFRRSLMVLGPIAAATASNVGWEAALQAPLGVRVQDWPGRVVKSFTFALQLPDQVIGVFGWLDTPMQPLIYTLWWGMMLSAITVGVLGASRRRLVILGATSVTAALLAVLLALPLASLGGSENVIQGRHLLAFVVVIPLVAGEMLLNFRDRAGAQVATRVARVATALMGGTALIQAIAWHHNGRRYAGNDRFLFWVGSTEWSPPLGWSPWLAVVALGVMGIMGAGLIALRPMPGCVPQP